MNASNAWSVAARPRWLAAALWALVGVTTDAWSQPSPPAPRCPRHRPAEGARCESPGRACRWGCGVEGNRDWRCACRCAEGRCAWRCAQGMVCPM